MQDKVDSSFRVFINRYQELREEDVLYFGPKGDLHNMPASSIKQSEWDDLLVIMEYKLGN